MQGRRCIEQMCQSAGVSRAGFYRYLRRHDPAAEQMELRAAIQQVFVEHKRRYGYRRVTCELRARGLLVNHKRVARLMRQDNLLAVQLRAFAVTTDSDHDYEVSLNWPAGSPSAASTNSGWPTSPTSVCMPSSSTRPS